MKRDPMTHLCAAPTRERAAQWVALLASRGIDAVVRRRGDTWEVVVEPDALELAHLVHGLTLLDTPRRGARRWKRLFAVAAAAHALWLVPLALGAFASGPPALAAGWQVIDLDDDGVADAVHHLDASGELRMAENDDDGDGRPERAVIVRAGRPTALWFDTNGDGAYDRFQQIGLPGLSQLAEDRDGDGVPERLHGGGRAP